MLIFADSGSGKTNVLLNWIEEQGSDSPIEKIYSYAKNLSEPKYRPKTFTWPKIIYRIFIIYGWCLQ